MKTRKYKDNQQRKNFARNESNVLLIQYFKKKREYSDNKLSINGVSSFNNSSSYAIQKTFCTKKWSDFQYSKSLSNFFLEQPALKSVFLLMKLKDHRMLLSHKKLVKDYEARVMLSNNSGSRPDGATNKEIIKNEDYSMKFAIINIAIKMCYGPIGSQQKKTKIRIRGRCIQTNRPRSVSRLLRLSRIRTRSLALEGKITGCTRSTW